MATETREQNEIASNERGASTIEYALIVALMAIGCVSATQAVAGGIELNLDMRAAEAMKQAGGEIFIP